MAIVFSTRLKVFNIKKIIGHKTKKARYDQFGHAGMGGAASDFSGFDISDIFSHFGDVFSGMGFGSGFGGGFGGGGQRAVRKGGNIRIKVKLTLEETATTTEKKIKINKYVPCTHCNGTGAKSEQGKKQCPTCQFLT